ncbi:MAG: toprim domain-containing protein, partial [Conexibacteraceae bacterium]|nr:toprim domain-containing protein [Conexibacteraceae bacterium]
RARRERLYTLLNRATTYYERQLWESAEARAARDYLAGRGFAEQTLREFRVGYAPDAWEQIVRGSRGAGFTDEELLAVGLAQPKRGRADELLDRFRGRIMFPTGDPRGRVRGFGARILAHPPGDHTPKYMNTSEGPLYHKREVLYGISLARSAAAKAGRMVLAEGYTDVLALHQAGIRNAVGIMGTSLTKEQVGELVRLVGVLELCLDADRAGQDAIVRAADLCAESKLELRVVPLPPGADPGELIATEGVEALRDRVATSVPYVVFEVERILERADLDSAEGKDRAIVELRRPLGPLGQSVLRDELVRRSAGRLALSETRLAMLLADGRRSTGAGFRGRGTAGPDPGQIAVTATGVLDQGVRSERSFLAMCVAAPTPGELALAAIDPDVHLTSAVLRRAARHLTGRLAAPLSGLPAGDEELARVVAELVSRASRGSRVGADQLEHARLLLELGRIERELARVTGAAAAPAPGHGIVELARKRQDVREAIGRAVARIERAS